MKHLFAFAALSLIALVGCNKNKKPAAASADTNPKVTEVAPPAPVHQPVVQQPIVQPVTTVTPVVDTAPEPVVSKPVKESGPVAGKSYTVQKGDTLWSIAQKTYGDGKQYKKIVLANPSIKGDKVAAGQKITLP